MDLLVNSADSGVRKAPEDVTLEDFDRIFATNVRGPYFASCGVRVNAVVPGFMDSPLNAHRKEIPAQVELIVGGTPLGRGGTPADVAHAVVMLASDGAAFLAWGRG